MMRVYTITALGSLLLGCAGGAELWSRQGEELQSEYEERQQDADQCLESFGLCLAESLEDDAISACADDLQTCLAVELPGDEEEDGEDDPDNPFGESGDQDDEPEDDDPEDDDPFDMDPGDEPDADPDEDDDEDEPLGAECQPILDLCLDDPGNFDPFCLEDFEECIQVAVAFELQELCDEIEAKCLELEIPNFDCFDVCG
jgi:hypothetical protein